MSYKNIILIGAGGNLGPALLTQLQSSSAFNITILSRQSSKSTFPSDIKVIKIADDYPASELEAAFKDQDAVLSFVGGEGVKAQTKFIDACAKAGVKRFFPSEYGANLEHPKATEICPVFQAKVDIVKYMRKQEGSGVEWTSVCTGPFFDWCLKVGFLGINSSSKTATIYDSGSSRWSGTNLSTIGRALVSILKDPSSTANKYIYISSFTTSQNEVLAAAEKASNGATFAVTKSTVKELIESGNEKMGKGDYSGIGDLIIANLYGGEGNDFEKESWNEKLGLKKETLEETVDCVVKKGELAP